MAIRLLSGSKRRKRGQQNIVAVGLICVTALVSVVLLTRKQPPLKHEAPQVVAEFDTVNLPVPTEFVPAGTKVKDIHFANIQFPKHQVPEGAVRSIETIANQVTTAPLPAKLPLFKENFSLTAVAANPVIEKIPPGMRAMTIKVDATSSVEGWAGSGTVVDVLLNEKEKTTVVAERVKILSTERQVGALDGGASPNVPSTVTILVTQEQCLAINTAIPLGRIAFALRSVKDEDAWGNTFYTSDRLRGGSGHVGNSDPVKGYIAVKDPREGSRAFALTGDKWTKTDVVPDGFFVDRKE